MFPDGTNTGRLPSLERVNRCSFRKLRSVNPPCELALTYSVPILVIRSPNWPNHETAADRRRGARSFSSTRRTSGATDAKGSPSLGPTQDSGIVSGFVRNEAQLAAGTAD